MAPCGHPCGRRDCPAGDRPAHPYRAEAYSALDEADGDFDRLRAEPDSSCTAEHAPVTLTARRTYRGRAFGRTRTYDNNCEATVRTGPVFSFREEPRPAHRRPYPCPRGGPSRLNLPHDGARPVQRATASRAGSPPILRPVPNHCSFKGGGVVLLR
ncbi:SSI family serine proteinase inhibitor [Streptomyces wedmorensis]|uniref:SSI family serine proteinase inhibitor n=1 Tax=Streptomyces wedmorensis TaxID=43759 RepID=UPI00379900B4